MANAAATGTPTPTTIHGPLGTALTYLWTHRSPVISYGLDRVEAYDTHIQILQIALSRAREGGLREHLAREWYHFSKRRTDFGADRGAGDHVAMLEGTFAEREEVQGVVGVARGLYEGGMRVVPRAVEGERAGEEGTVAPPAEPVKRGRGRPKGSKTKKRKVDGEWVLVPGVAAPEEGKEAKEGKEGVEGGEPRQKKKRGRPPKEDKEVFEGPKRPVGRPTKNPRPAHGNGSQAKEPPAKKCKTTNASVEQTPGYPTPTPPQQPPPTANHQNHAQVQPTQTPAPPAPPTPLPRHHPPTNTEPSPTWPPPELSHPSPLKNPFPWLAPTDFHAQAQAQAPPSTPPRRRHPREDAAAVVADKEELERPSSLLFEGDGEAFEGLFGGRVRVGEEEDGWMAAAAKTLSTAQTPPATTAPPPAQSPPSTTAPATATHRSITFRLDIFSSPPTTTTRSEGSAGSLLLDAPSPRTIASHHRNARGRRRSVSKRGGGLAGDGVGFREGV